MFLTLGLEVIKLEYSLKLKIKRNDWLLVDTCKIKPSRNDKKYPTFKRIRASPTGHDRPSTRRGLVNESKCQVLHITRTKFPIETKYILHGTGLESVSSAKYLGVTVSDNLSWTPHIDSVSKKATKH